VVLSVLELGKWNFYHMLSDFVSAVSQDFRAQDVPRR